MNKAREDVRAACISTIRTETNITRHLRNIADDIYYGRPEQLLQSDYDKTRYLSGIGEAQVLLALNTHGDVALNALDDIVAAQGHWYHQLTD